MHHPSYLLILVSRSRFILNIAFLGLLLAVVVSFFFPLKYSAVAGVFVIPRQGFGVDPYTVIKSSERVGENLALAIGTSEFLDRVLEAEPRIDKTVFPTEERLRRKYWKKNVEADVTPGTGLLRITAYSTDPAQAVILASGVNKTVMEHGIEYVGAQATFKIADEPIASRFPVRPNIPMNGLIGFLFGAILASIFVLFQKKNRA